MGAVWGSRLAPGHAGMMAGMMAGQRGAVHLLTTMVRMTVAIMPKRMSRSMKRVGASTPV